VNLLNRQLESYEDPTTARYGTCTVFDEDAEIEVAIDGTGIGSIRVDALLP
jgi:hypothetical protein